MPEDKKTLRRKTKEWADAHPQAVIIGSWVATMTGIISLSIYSSNKQRIVTNNQVLDDNKLTLDNNKLLADRQDKANDFAATAAASGHVVHTLTDGNLLAVPGNVPQKIHYT